MKTTTKLITTLSALALSACTLSQDGATNSGFRTPNSSGMITGGVDSDGQQTRRTFRDSAGGGFAYAGGTNDDGLAAYAGIIPGTTGGAQVASGSASYDATFNLYEVTGINLTETGIGEGFVTGRPNTVTGSITLTANFDSNRLTGTSTGGSLNVDGRIGGTDLSGDVTYRGVGGTLDGVIGADRTVGAFHGNNADVIFAGGFIGTPGD